MEGTITLNDGRLIAETAFEILSVPAVSDLSENSEFEQNRKCFSNMLSELSRLCNPGEAVLESMWLSLEDGSIRLTLSARVIARDKSILEQRLQSIGENIKARLEAGGFVHREIPFAELCNSKFLPEAGSSINALIKDEICTVSTMSPMPYYHCRPFTILDNFNFSELSMTLHSSPRCAIIFQLISTQWSIQEATAITAMKSMLEQMKTGFPTGGGVPMQDNSAKEPYECIKFFSDRSGLPMYLYNILAVGPRARCMLLTAQLQSMLQNTPSDRFRAINLDSEKYNIASSYLFYPWNLSNRIVYTYRNAALWDSGTIPLALARLPYVIFAEEASGFFRFPLYDSALTGIKNELINLHREQMISPNESTVCFGKLKVARGEGKELCCSINRLSKHMFIGGMPGTGKTTFAINILLQLHEKGIPFLVIEPSKTEYRAMIDAIPELQIFTPGNNSVSPFVINPFLPPKGVTAGQYLSSLLTAFEAAFSMEGPLKSAFTAAINESFTEYGWRRSSTSDDPKAVPFGLYEFIKIFRRKIALTRYSAEVRGNIETGGVIRLMNLIEQNPDIYDTVQAIPLEDLLNKPTVIELNNIDNYEQKSLLMALLLVAVCAYTKTNIEGDGRLKNIFMIDEAHVLLDTGQSKIQPQETANPEAITFRSIQNMIVEIRAYGMGFIIADQSPSRVGRTVVDNTDIKVGFRLVGSQDKEIFSDTTNMDEQSSRGLGVLSVGEAYIHFGGLQYPQLVKTEDIRDKKNIQLVVSGNEIVRRMTYWNSHQNLLIPFTECKKSKACNGKCDLKLREEAEFYASRLYYNKQVQIKTLEELEKVIFYLHRDLYTFVKENEEDKNQFVRLSNCVKIRFLRKACIDKNFMVNKEQYQKILEIILK